MSAAPPSAEPLSLPVPPLQTHREERSTLPELPAGDASSRLARAREYVRATGAQIEARHRAGAAGLSVCRLISEAQDRLVRGLFEELSAELGAPSAVCLVALGSFGRRELAPHSDLDLLMLSDPGMKADAVRPLAQALNTTLWDLKLQVGWSARTPAESGRAAEDDHTVRTALLDCRYIAGDPAVYAQLADRVLRELLTHKADSFIADKARELHARREKYGDSLYLLEPHLKQGEGGLRDLEAALWIAQARYRTRGLTGLLKQSVLPASQVGVLREARDFLLRIRNHLHYVRNRKEDRLSFDLQEEVAAFLGYPAAPGALPVEQFMRHYYLAAKAIRLAADALIARCEETRSRGWAPERKVGAFKVFRGRLTLDGDPALLSRTPAAIVALFRTADEEGLELYSWAKDHVREALPRLDDARATPEVVAEAKVLFARPGTRGGFLMAMHELGALGALLPEFGRVTAHHQHDLYHAYTVDVHSLFAVRRLYALRAGELVQEQPELSREMRDLADPLPLYLGMLLHDCGKGLGGDHSERGRALAADVAHRWTLSHRQREVLEFLVAQHLAMSRTAQRRDLSDPHLISEFARLMGDAEKLTCLYLLTYADISSVGPQMWTEWKARLLEELYQKARAQLVGQTDGGGNPLARGRAAFIERWRHSVGASAAESLAASLPDHYFLSTDPRHAARHARLLARARSGELAASLAHRREHGSSELTLCARDRPGLLALFAGVLSAHRVDILSARIASTDDGLALDALDVRAPRGQLLERERWRAARADLERVLAGETTVEAVIQRRAGASLLARPLPRVPIKVSVDNRASQRFTVVDVRAEDRVGLLYAIASALHGCGAEIALARVNTEAHRAIDSFYVTRSRGKVVESAEMDELVRRVEAAVQATEHEGSAG
jgi:[protein-PII] uridylyltransferase